MKERYDVIVIGGGPAGLAAAISSREHDADTLIIEREGQLGGILKQCVHDGFGLLRYGEALTGPEYAAYDIARVKELAVDCALSTFVLDAHASEGGFELDLSNREGIHRVWAKALILAMGCRERTARQVFIHGDRPSGVLTAGCAQNLVNIQGMLPGKRVVILGSGDIGLIMARRLALEGAEVLGVYEAKPSPSGLARNVAQCLDDFGIPLHLSTTVTRTLGGDRLEAVEVCGLDEHMQPIEGTEELIPCDTLVLSVGLIPENELSEQLGVPISRGTRGPVVDQSLETLIEGVFCAGNCLSVNDLVDHVSEHGSIAGASAASYVRHGSRTRDLREVVCGRGIASSVPQCIDATGELEQLLFYLRPDADYYGASLVIETDGGEVLHKRYQAIRQAESLRVQTKLQHLGKNVRIRIEHS